MISPLRGGKIELTCRAELRQGGEETMDLVPVGESMAVAASDVQIAEVLGGGDERGAAAGRASRFYRCLYRGGKCRFA